MLSVALFLLAIGGPAGAVDGVLEINQTCASNTGCFPGDSAGFPVEITTSAPGQSFRLTSDLALPDENTSGITIAANASDVSIDLNGFSIRGVTVCSGSPTSCAPLGSGTGVFSGSAERTEVHNGAVAGMGSNGIQVGTGGMVRDVRVTTNGGWGVVAGEGSLVEDCTATRNGESGIAVIGGLVTNSTATSNRLRGIDASTSVDAAPQSTLIGNYVASNGDFGIRASGCLIRENTATLNATDGIHDLGSSLIIGNVVNENGNDGIEAAYGSKLSGNVVGFNGAFGFNFNSSIGMTYDGNTLVGNTTAPISVGGINLGGNYCDGSGTSSASCP